MGQPKKIVVIEDEIFLAKIWRAKLEKIGYKVFVEYAGGNAFRLIKNQRPNLVILDIVLPEENGFDILKKLKEDGSTKTIPIIILTKLGDKKDIQMGMTLQATRYLVKSEINFRTVLKTIQEILI